MGSALRFGAITTYGALFESLLRGWHLLPVGLYRRRTPGVAPQPPVVEDPAAHFIAAFGGVYIPGVTPAATAGAWFNGGGSSGTAGVFRNEKGLLSYVFTNPPPTTLLNVNDLVYVLRPDIAAGSVRAGDD